MLYEISEKAIQLENQGKEIIKFNLGDPDLPTPPEIIEAAYEAMKQGKTKYSSAAGEKVLRDELAVIHGVSADNVVVTTGSKWAVFSLMFLLLKKGDNVVAPSPHWTSYELEAKRVGAEFRTLKSDLESDWKVDVEKLEALVDEDTRMIILNSPNNPTSKVIDDKTFGEIVQMANRKEVTVLSDEVYSDISFVKAKSILDFGEDNIMVSGFSKSFLMTGWRIGYAVVEKELAKRMIKLNQITTTCVPAFIQYGALKGLESRKRIADDIRRTFKVRADAAYCVLSTANMRFSRPDAPFYMFPKVDGLDSEHFALDLLDNGVAVAPGTAFGDYREYFRIALTVGEDKIREGLEKLCEALP
ncbi:aminotransferase class I/II-fold pyridoxal phosphate-dependent enzyme [Candidatus Bathyarchaeota archaeon]|nr:aminotransferase class I/II-fold pyridoxal phosphate-dependent enzyme [Candidatus Bathyarchaeota archaeon]